MISIEEVVCFCGNVFVSNMISIGEVVCFCGNVFENVYAYV